MVVVTESTITLTEIEINDVTNRVSNPLVDDGNQEIKSYLQVQNYLKIEYLQWNMYIEGIEM